MLIEQNRAIDSSRQKVMNLHCSCNHPLSKKKGRPKSALFCSVLFASWQLEPVCCTREEEAVDVVKTRIRVVVARSCSYICGQWRIFCKHIVDARSQCDVFCQDVVTRNIQVVPLLHVIVHLLRARGRSCSVQSIQSSFTDVSPSRCDAQSFNWRGPSTEQSMLELWVW